MESAPLAPDGPVTARSSNAAGVPLVFICDKPYRLGMVVAISSIFQHTVPMTRVIVVDLGLSDESRQCLEYKVVDSTAYDNCSLASRRVQPVHLQLIHTHGVAWVMSQTHV